MFVPSANSWNKSGWKRVPGELLSSWAPWQPQHHCYPWWETRRAASQPDKILGWKAQSAPCAGLWSRLLAFPSMCHAAVGVKGTLQPSFPALTVWILQRTAGQGPLPVRGSTCFWSAKGQSRDQHLAQSSLHCGAIFPLFFKSASNPFKNNYWKEQNSIFFWTALASTQGDLRKLNASSWKAGHGRWLGLKPCCSPLARFRI